MLDDPFNEAPSSRMYLRSHLFQPWVGASEWSAAAIGMSATSVSNFTVNFLVPLSFLSALLSILDNDDGSGMVRNDVWKSQKTIVDERAVAKVLVYICYQVGVLLASHTHLSEPPAGASMEPLALPTIDASLFVKSLSYPEYEPKPPPPPSATFVSRLKVELTG